VVKFSRPKKSHKEPATCEEVFDFDRVEVGAIKTIELLPHYSIVELLAMD